MNKFVAGIRDRFSSLDIEDCHLDSLRLQTEKLLEFDLRDLREGKPHGTHNILAFYQVVDSIIDVNVTQGLESPYGGTLGAIVRYNASVDSGYLLERVSALQSKVGEDLADSFIHFEIELTVGRLDMVAVDFGLHRLSTIQFL